MSTAIRVGPASVEVHRSSIYDLNRGGQVMAVYEGDAAGITQVANGLQWYERFEIDGSQAPLWRITVYSPEPAEAPVWELLSNLREFDITEHPNYAPVSDEHVSKILKYLKNPTPTTPPDLGGNALATELFQLMLHGTKKYFTEDYVLRYTVTATNAVQINLAYSNTDRVYDKELTGSGLVLPNGISTSISNIPNKTAPNAKWMWGWLKRAPTARQSVIGKVVVTGEYWLSLWPLRLYPAA